MLSANIPTARTVVIKDAGQVQAKLAKPDGVVCNTALWTIGNRELSGIAEEIAAWISTEADEPKDMETAITVWDRRLDDSPSH